MATFSETLAVTLPQDIVKQGNNVSKVWEKPKLICSHSSVFALE